MNARWILGKLALLTTTFAPTFANPAPNPQYGPGGYNPGNGSPYSTGGGGSSGFGLGPTASGSGSGSGSSAGFGGFTGAGDFSDRMRAAERARAVHGILAAVAMVILFPTGAVLMRVLPGRAALWMHALTQIAALGVLVGAVGVGLQLVQEVRDNIGVDLFRESNTRYHLIIGLVVMSCLVVQPILGLIHHERFRRVQRRQVWSYLHLFNGRVPITLGIVNGGLGLWIAGASDRLKVAYLAAAAAMWALWMMVALWHEWRRWTKGRPWNWRLWRRRKVNEGDVSF